MFKKKKYFAWFDGLYKSYKKGKLEEPYSSLLFYFYNLTLGTPLWKKEFKSHYKFFFGK